MLSAVTKSSSQGTRVKYQLLSKLSESAERIETTRNRNGSFPAYILRQECGTADTLDGGFIVLERTPLETERFLVSFAVKYYD